MTLRQTIANLMVNIHRISPELASSHVAAMDDAEVRFRFRMYSRQAGMELSVEGPNLRAGNPVSAQVRGPATMTAGRRHSTAFPEGAHDEQ